MVKAKLEDFCFRNIHYTFDPSAPHSNDVEGHINLQVGRPKSGKWTSCVVRIRFQLTSKDGLALTVSGDGEARFSLAADCDQELSREEMETLCVKPAYEEYSKRVTELLELTGSVQGIQLSSFDGLTPDQE